MEICKGCHGTGKWPFGGFENGELCDNICPDCLGEGKRKRKDVSMEKCFTLTFKVQLTTNESDDDIKNRLLGIIDHALDRGMVTGESDTEVISWKADAENEEDKE
jgi:hypothetical protein